MKRRFVQDPVTLKLIEVTDDYMPSRSAKADGALWGDRHYEGMTTTDGKDISSRSKHRQYMRETGMTTFDDYKETFAKKQAERDAYHMGQRGSVDRRDIERAIHKLTNR